MYNYITMPHKSKDDHNAYHKQYQLERYHRRRAEAISTLGGKCNQCDETSELEIDHIDPSTKAFALNKLWSCAYSKFQAELLKCQLLCKEHHILKSIYDANNLPAKDTDRHGTLSMHRYCRCRLCLDAWNIYCAQFK